MSGRSGADRDLLDAAPAAYMVTDLGGRIDVVNKVLESWIEHRADDAPLGVRDLLTAPSCLYYENVLTPALSLSGVLSDAALELRSGDSVRHTLWAAKRLTDQEVHWVGIDVTARRQHDQELISVQRRLARLQSLSSDLLVDRTLDAIGEVLLQHLVDGIKADHGAVAVFGEGSRLDVAAERSLGRATYGDALQDDPWVAAALLERQPVFATAEPGEHPGAADETIQVAAIPLGTDPMLGVLRLGLARPVPHGAEEQELLVAAADIATSSLERALLLDRLEREARRNAGLSRLLHVMEAEQSVWARAQRMAEVLVEEHGGMAVVDLHEHAPELVGLCHAERRLEPTVRWLHERLHRPGPDPSDESGAAPTRLPDLHDVPPDRDLTLEGLTPAEAAAVQDLGLESYVVMPLVARGASIGTLSLGSSRVVEAGSEGYYARLADACALSLDNARLYEHEQGIARQLQSTLLPARLPRDEARRFTLRRFYRAGRDALQVGGDWYDAFWVDEDRLALVVGDVVGGGLGAARTMGKLRTATHAFSQDGRGVAHTLAGLHRFATRTPEALASTVFYAEIDLTANTLEHGCAGHLPPILLPPDGDPEPLRGGRGVVLGMGTTTWPPVATLALQPGTRLVMYTDGLIERPSRLIDDSIAHLVAVLRDDPSLAGRLDALAGALGSEDSSDDTCILSFALAAGSD